MEIQFDHVQGFGKMMHRDFLHAPCKAKQTTETPEEMYEKGFIWWQGDWYPVRSTRIVVQDLVDAIYKGPKSSLIERCDRCITHMWKVNKIFVRPHMVDVSTLDYEQMRKLTGLMLGVYLEYTTRKNFDRHLMLSEMLDGVTHIMCMVEDNFHGTEVCMVPTNILSFNLLTAYPNALVATQHASKAYEGVPLGLESILNECLWAARRNIPYVYQLSGYESCCAYKARFPGFQWWTGKEWSRNKKLYRKLLKRDDNVELGGLDDYDA